MPGEILNITHLRPLQLVNTDFGHAPLGKLGKREVQHIGKVTPERNVTFVEPPKKTLSSRKAEVAPPPLTAGEKAALKEAELAQSSNRYRIRLGVFSEELSSTLGKIATTDTSTQKGRQEVTNALQRMHDMGMSMSQDYGRPKCREIIEAQFQVKFSQMSPDEKLKVQEGLHKASQNGIDLKGIRVLSGELTPKAQTEASLVLADRRTTVHLTEHRWVDGSPSGISEKFFNTLSSVQLAGSPLLVKDANGHISENQMKEGVARLKAWVGNDTVFEQLSESIPERVLSGIESVQLSEDSPIKLPDGKCGSLTGPQETVYNLWKGGGPNHNVNLAVTHEVKGTRFNAIGEPPQDTVLGHSKSKFEMNIVFPRDGQPSMDRPVKFDYQVRISKTWDNDNYTRPTNTSDIMNRGNPELMSDFREHLAEKRLEENLDFLQAYIDIPSNITCDQAKAMAAKYLTPGGPDYINIGYPMATPMLAEINAMTPQTFTVDAFKEKFLPAYTEVTLLLDTNVNGVKGFITSQEFNQPN